jgi:glutathione S-transferase
MTTHREITLFGFGPGFGLPEMSPYVTKTELQLQMARIPYRKERSTPDQSPKGQLPFIDDDGERVADSTFIRAHLERRYGVDLDAPLDERTRAEAWAVERMIENHFGWASVHARWLDPDNFAKGPGRFFDGAPEAVRAKLREDVQARVAANVRAVGIARHAPDQIVWLADRSLRALSTILGEKPYLFGDRPCGVDATAFGALAGILTPFFDSPLRRRAESYASLVAYVDRMMARYYPEHAWGRRAALPPVARRWKSPGRSPPRAAPFASVSPSARTSPRSARRAVRRTSRSRSTARSSSPRPNAECRPCCAPPRRGRARSCRRASAPRPSAACRGRPS